MIRICRGVNAPNSMRKPGNMGIGCVEYFSRVLGTEPGNLIRFWPLNELSGVNVTDLAMGKTGTYSGTTLNAIVSPNGRPAGFWDGVNDTTNVLADLDADFASRNEFTIAGWFKVFSKDTWTDATRRYITEIYSDGDNKTTIEKHSTDDQFRTQIEMNTQVYRDAFDGITSLNWNGFGLKIFTAGANKTTRLFINGVPEETDTEVSQAWVGALAKAALGSNRNGLSNFFHGYLSNIAIWDTVLSDGQLRSLGRV